MGEQFLRSYGEQEQDQEQEHQRVKTKKAPLREGPKYFLLHSLFAILTRRTQILSKSGGFTIPKVLQVSATSCPVDVSGYSQ